MPEDAQRDQTDELLQSWMVADALQPAVRGPPAGPGRVLLPGPVRGRRGAAAGHARRHGQVAHPLRAARPAARARGDGGAVMSTDEFATYDAAYVLGALSPTERMAYEAHLTGCPSCSGAVTELAGLPGLLAKVAAGGGHRSARRSPAGDAAARAAARGRGPASPPPAGRRPVGGRRRGRHRGRRRGAGVLAGIGRATARRRWPPPRRRGRDLVAVVPSPVTASVAMVPMGWGTRLDLQLRLLRARGGSATPAGVHPGGAQPDGAQPAGGGVAGACPASGCP